MPLLDFTLPAKARPHAEHAERFSSDTGIAGTYVPNMSASDRDRWKAKHVNVGKDDARIELRRTFRGVQLVIFVAMDGWNFKHEQQVHNYASYSTKGMNVRMSMNGPLMLTFDDFAEIDTIVGQAREVLEGE